MVEPQVPQCYQPGQCRVLWGSSSVSRTFLTRLANVALWKVISLPCDFSKSCVAQYFFFHACIGNFVKQCKDAHYLQ